MSKQRRKFLERARTCVTEHKALGEILEPGEYRELIQPGNDYGETMYSFEWFSEWDNRVFTEITMGRYYNGLSRKYEGRVYTVSMSFRTDAHDELIEYTLSCDKLSELPETFDRVYSWLRWGILEDAVNSGKETLA